MENDRILNEVFYNLNNYLYHLALETCVIGCLNQYEFSLPPAIRASTNPTFSPTAELFQTSSSPSFFRTKSPQETVEKAGGFMIYKIPNRQQAIKIWALAQEQNLGDFLDVTVSVSSDSISNDKYQVY